MSAWLICPCCKARVTELATLSYCYACWYAHLGGDLAPSGLLNVPPFAWVSA